MKLFENGVGRPSNETLKKRRTFIASIAIAIIAVLTIGVYALSNLSLSGLVGSVNYVKGQEVALSKTPVYLTAKTKISLSKKTGTFYIYDKKVQNGRIKISSKKNGTSIGWVEVSKITINQTTRATAKTIKKTSTNSVVYKKLSKDLIDKGTRVNVRGYIYADAKSNEVLKKTVGTYFISDATIINNRVAVTTSNNYLGDTSKIEGWVSIDQLYEIDTTNKTTSQNKVTSSLKQGAAVNLKSVNVYLTATSKVKKGTKSGTFYIWSATQKNGRIRITNKKNYVGKTGRSIGWVDVSDITGKSSSASTKIVYQKYTAGQVLQLVKKANNSTNKNASKYVFSRVTSSSSNIENFTVVKNSDEKTATVLIKDDIENTYTVPKINIAGARVVVASDNVKTTTYYHTYEEAKASAPTNASIKDLTATSKTTANSK